MRLLKIFLITFSFLFSRQINAQIYLRSFGEGGSANGQFKFPSDVAIDSIGNMYIADRDNSRIQVFNNDGKFVRVIGKNGRGIGDFAFGGLVSLKVDKFGKVYAADSYNSRIQIFDNSGNFIKLFGDNGVLVGSLTSPTELALDYNGFVYISDSQVGINTVQKFDTAGQFLNLIGGTGTLPGQFIRPSGITIKANGEISVMDYGNRRIQIFDSNGKILRLITENSMTYKGLLGFASGLSTDKCGNYYSVDPRNNTIVIFQENGTLLKEFGSTGSLLGQFSGIDNVELDKNGNIYIPDSYNNRIQIFSPLQVSSLLGSNIQINPACTNKESCFSYSNICSIKNSSLLWDFGDTINIGTNTIIGFNVKHKFTSAGTYNIQTILLDSTLTRPLDTIVNTIQITNFTPKPILGDDILVPCFQVVNLSTTGFDAYSWNTGEHLSTITVTSPGTYWVNATNACGTKSDTVKINWIPPNPVPIHFQQQLITVSDSCIINSIKFSLLDSTNVVEVKWDFGDGITSSLISPYHQYQSTLNYRILVKANKFCFIDSSFRNMSIEPVPSFSLGADTALVCGTKFILKAPSGYHKYTWQDGTNSNTFKVSTSGNYEVTVKNACGLFSDSVQIRTKKPEIPNIFTPNGDEVNDCFFIQNNPEYAKLTIINRLNQEVYRTTNYQNDWQAEKVPDGIYFYQYDSGCEVQKGYVQVIR